VVLVFIILLAWVVILGPSLLKRRSRSGGTQSITHFHYQLRVLEHSAPEPIVAPAYRLRAVDGTGAATGITYPERSTPPVLTVVGAKELPRPALAFLGDPVDDGADPVVDDETEPPPSVLYDGPGAGLPVRAPRGVRAAADGPAEWAAAPRAVEASSRQLARRRRRDTLTVLAAIFGVTLVLGAATGSSALWALFALDAVALAGYVAVLVHLRRLALERERKLHYLDPPVESGGYRVGGLPSPVGGRYAHPSSGNAAAR
jgi:hypothetical protein